MNLVMKVAIGVFSWVASYHKIHMKCSHGYEQVSSHGLLSKTAHEISMKQHPLQSYLNRFIGLLKDFHGCKLLMGRSDSLP